MIPNKSSRPPIWGNRFISKVNGARKVKTAKIGTVNLIVEHFGVVTMCSTTKFTVPIFAVIDV